MVAGVNHLEQLEQSVLKWGHTFGEKIDQSSSALRSRVYALAIPAFCLIAELSRIAADLGRLAEFAYRLITQGTSDTGNVQTGVMHVAEHIRHLTGCLGGAVLGVITPHLARETFLTVEAKKLQACLNEESASKLYAVGELLGRFFASHHIPYRMCSGTQLGAFRHQGIIPWDDDMDLMLYPESVARFKTLVEEGAFSRETGLEITWQPFTKGWQCFYPGSSFGEGPLKAVGLPFVDIFSTRFDEKREKILYDSFEQRQLSTGDFFWIEEWDAPQVYPFGPIQLIGIQNPEAYIKRSYGNDACDFAYQTMHHEALAEIWQSPLNLVGIIQKLWHYGLPRRAYIGDRSPIGYQQGDFQQYVREASLRFLDDRGAVS